MPDLAVGREITGDNVASPPAEVRERLTDAATRIATDNGFLAVNIEQIANSAGLTVDDFHRYFDTKEQCLLAGYDNFIQRLFEHIDEACESVQSWPEKVKTTIESAFEFIVELESVARMFAIDAMRIGPAALDRKCASIDSAARRLKHGRLLFSKADEMPDTTERTLVAGVVMLVAIHLLAEEATLLPTVRAEAIEMVLTPYIGIRRARELASP
jgi:AcrR family transcriptional regulator